MKKILLLSPLLFASCAGNPQSSLEPALNAISADSLMGEIKTLSSDEFEGRKPGTAGEDKTVAYMQQQFQTMGLKPGNPDGTYLQKVPLAGITSKAQADFTVKGKKLPAMLNKDLVAVSTRFVPEIGRQGFRHRLRRLWRGRSGIRLGRLQGCGRQRQNHPHAGERSADSRSERPLEARSPICSTARR